MLIETIVDLFVLVVLVDLFFLLFELVFTRVKCCEKFSKPSSSFIYSLYFSTNIWLYILYKKENTPLQFERLIMISQYYVFFVVVFCIYFIIDLLPKKKSDESGHFKPKVYGLAMTYLLPFGLASYLLLNNLKWNAMTHIYLSMFAILLCLCELKFIYKLNLSDVLKLMVTEQVE